MSEEIRENRLTGYINLKSLLLNTIEKGNPNALVDAIILYEQGHECDDCGQTYSVCRCEKCSECGFRRNLCYLNIENKGPYAKYYTEEERERVKEAGYQLILEILADDIYNDGRKYSIIPDNKYRDLNELKKEFLKRSLQKDNIDLSEADLSEADLIGANLSGANLSGADLFGANLTGADLTEACLSEACLSGANLSGANLSGANLYRANLYRANFTNAKITNSTNFTDAYHIDQAIGLIILNPRKKSPMKKRVK